MTVVFGGGLWDSQSNPMDGYDTEVLDSPSIGARIFHLFVDGWSNGW